MERKHKKRIEMHSPVVLTRNSFTVEIVLSKWILADDYHALMFFIDVPLRPRFKSWIIRHNKADGT